MVLSELTISVNWQYGVLLLVVLPVVLDEVLDVVFPEPGVLAVSFLLQAVKNAALMQARRMIFFI